jgi:hypothetical protein
LYKKGIINRKIGEKKKVQSEPKNRTFAFFGENFQKIFFFKNEKITLIDDF